MGVEDLLSRSGYMIERNRQDATGSFNHQPSGRHQEQFLSRDRRPLSLELLIRIEQAE
jgi:hypothetical protein